MQTFYYKVHPDNDRSMKFMLTREQAQELYDQIGQDLGHAEPDEPTEQVVTRKPLVAYANELKWDTVYRGTRTNCLFKLTHHGMLYWNEDLEEWQPDNHLFIMENTGGSFREE